MKQRELADLMGVHVTTVGYWERGKFFPEQHWAALNKLLHIDLRAPGVIQATPAPELDDDTELIEALRRAYRNDPERVREALEAVRWAESLPSEPRETGESPREQRAG